VSRSDAGADLRRPAKRIVVLVVAVALLFFGNAVYGQAPRPVLCEGLTGDALSRCLYSDVDDRLRALGSAPTTAPVPTASTASGRGMLLGTSGQNSKSQAHIEGSAGRPVGLRRTYWRANQVAPSIAMIRDDRAAGRLPWPSWKFPGDWASVAAGTHDAWARDLRDRLIGLNIEVWVSFHHEPEGDEGNTPADHRRWRDAQTRMARIFDERPSRIKFWLVTTGWSQEIDPDREAIGVTWDNLYPTAAPPGSIYGIAYDPYNWFGVKNAPWTELQVLMAPLKAEADERGVRWGVAEWGYTDLAYARDPAWIDRAVAYGRANGAEGMAYFDTTNSDMTWPLTGGKLARFVKLVKESAVP
jgi:hypothetical protein